MSMLHLIVYIPYLLHMYVHIYTSTFILLTLFGESEISACSNTVEVNGNSCSIFGSSTIFTGISLFPKNKNYN